MSQSSLLDEALSLPRVDYISAPGSFGKNSGIGVNGGQAVIIDPRKPNHKYNRKHYVGTWEFSFCLAATFFQPDTGIMAVTHEATSPIGGSSLIQDVVRRIRIASGKDRLNIGLFGICPELAGADFDSVKEVMGEASWEEIAIKVLEQLNCIGATVTAFEVGRKRGSTTCVAIDRNGNFLDGDNQRRIGDIMCDKWERVNGSGVVFDGTTSPTLRRSHTVTSPKEL